MAKPTIDECVRVIAQATGAPMGQVAAILYRQAVEMNMDVEELVRTQYASALKTLPGPKSWREITLKLVDFDPETGLRHEVERVLDCASMGDLIQEGVILNDVYAELVHLVEQKRECTRRELVERQITSQPTAIK